MHKRVLVVDDNQAIRLIVRSALEMQTSFIVHEACDGVDAVEKAGSLNPDLVVMDLSMPRMHGLEATRKLKSNGHPVQVILFTVHKSAITDSEADEAGLDAIISKTDGIEPLVRKVQNLLGPVH